MLEKMRLGTGGVQGQGKGQRLLGIKAVNNSIGLATCHGKIYEKYPPCAAMLQVGL